jgi:hypothetical protein
MMITRNKVFALFASVLLCAAVVQAGEITPVDFGIEANTAWVLMPSSTQGSIVLTCDDCNQQSFQLTNQTLYKVGNSPVSFAEFIVSVRAGSARNLMVFVATDNRTVTRMIVSAAPSK